MKLAIVATAPRKFVGERTNDRDMGQFGADELARNGEDQAGLNQAGGLQRWVVEKIGKRQAGYGILKWRHRLLYSVTRKINPFQKVSDLVSTDAKSDLKHFRVRHFLTHGRVKTRAALLNVSKVKARYIRDRLNMLVTGKIGVGSRR